MKQIIRNNIFETNSSSIHSISILNTNKKGKLEDLHYHIKFGIYDKDRQILSKPKDILNYFWTMLHSCEMNLGNMYIELMKK